MTDTVVDHVGKRFGATVGGTEREAVVDVSFVAEPGSGLAVIGPNGAGKSTLLRMLAGISAPTSGRIRRPARCAAMIELGSGFHPDLTVAENLTLGLVVSGLPARTARRRTAAAAEFAGLEEYLDLASKHLSSGMTARLAAAVATGSDPELLLVDEVLAVGDDAFQRRVRERVAELVAGGTTLILVTHSLDLALATTTRTIWLDQGRMVDDGPTGRVVDAYAASVRRPAAAALDAVRIVGLSAEPPHVDPGDTLTMVAELSCEQVTDDLTVQLAVRPVVGEDSAWMRIPDEPAEMRQINVVARSAATPLGRLTVGRHVVRVVVEDVPVSESAVEISVEIRDRHHRLVDELPLDVAIGARALRPHYALRARVTDGR